MGWRGGGELVGSPLRVCMHMNYYVYSLNTEGYEHNIGTGAHAARTQYRRTARLYFMYGRLLRVKTSRARRFFLFSDSTKEREMRLFERVQPIFIFIHSSRSPLITHTHADHSKGRSDNFGRLANRYCASGSSRAFY